MKSLVTGMAVTGRELVTPKVTEQYPENRDTLRISDRFRAELTLKYDAEGRHKCIACGICQMNCPNGTIKLTTKWSTARWQEEAQTRQVCLRPWELYVLYALCHNLSAGCTRILQ